MKNIDTDRSIASETKINRLPGNTSLI